MADERAGSASGPRGPSPMRRRRRRWSRFGRQERPGSRAFPAAAEQFYAALDLGTNNCRLLVAHPTPHSFQVIDAFSRIIRLGEGLSRTGQLADAAIERAIDALKVCALKLARRKNVRTRLIATEAARAATNSAEFLLRVKQETGLTLEVIDRETEAGLAAYGCAPLLDPGASGAILFDIGGGSSELVLLDKSSNVDRGPPVARMRAWTSLPMGVVSLAERHGGEAVSREVFETMVDEAVPLVAQFAQAADAEGAKGIHLLGTSGTVTTIAGVHLELPRYDRKMVDGVWLCTKEVNAVVERLIATSYAERVAHPCIGAERADLVLAGCAIFEAIRRVFPCERLRVADRGLREGILVQLMRADGAWREPRLS
jgi:exopolyphosphatase/guanosine-5'-triphosphate,3'-diphosphate pyrophosphatase